jgi:ribose/xylose/arabinose/galactoside ABC-type transport system permease subunit
VTEASLQRPATDNAAELRARPARLLQKYGIYAALVILLVVGGIVSQTFISANNLSNLLLQVSPLGIVVIGQAFVILVRGLDLSVASMMATAAVIATGFSGQNADVPVIVAFSLAIGFGVGLLNGLLVTKRSVSPFLATLATMILLQGFRFAYTQGAPSGNVPPFFRVLGSMTYFGLPYNFVILAVLSVVFWVLLSRSPFGRRVYIVGGNPTTGRLVGINSDIVTIACYVISSCLAAVAGLILSGYVGLVDNWVGQGFELDSIVAAVIGGVALSGGQGTIAGALAGAAIIVVISNEVLLFGLPIQLQIIIKGVVIVFAAAFYVKRQR